MSKPNLKNCVQVYRLNKEVMLWNSKKKKQGTNKVDKQSFNSLRVEVCFTPLYNSLLLVGRLVIWLLRIQFFN